MADAPTTAVLFDIDGTLADSNYAHIDAWWRAFLAAGESVDAWRIHRAIGMDSAKLLETLLPDASQETRDTAKQFHTAYYAEQMPRLRLLPGARELLQAVAEAGHAVVLATSAPDHVLARLRDLLDAGERVTAETCSEDVEQAKPDPHHPGRARQGRGLRRRRRDGRGCHVGRRVRRQGGGSVRRRHDRRHRR